MTHSDVTPRLVDTPREFGVTVYSTGPECMRCTLTIRRLSEHGIPFDVVDLSVADTKAAREYVTDDLGYFEAPVVVVGDHPQHHWSGFRPDLIDRLAKAFPSIKTADHID